MAEAYKKNLQQFVSTTERKFPIRIFYGDRGSGKTSAVVAIAQEDMYGENADWALEQANAEVAELNAKGFHVSPPKSEHLVYCAKPLTIDVESPDFGHRVSLELDPNRLGIATEEDFIPQFVYRGSTLVIDELPKYFSSRAWQKFFDGMSLYWSESRKHKIKMYATCQYMDQVEKSIRCHAQITYVHGIEYVYDKFGDVIQSIWTLDNWERYGDWETKKKPTREIYVYNGDIRQAYDTNEGEEDYYIGLEKSDFSCEHSKRVEYTPEAIAEYAKKMQSSASNRETK